MSSDERKWPPPSMENSLWCKYTPWLRVSATLEKGSQRKYMEDRILTSKFSYLLPPSGLKGKKDIRKKDMRKQHYYVFLLLDGHGGSQVVDFVHQHFMDELEKQVVRHHGKKLGDIIRATFLSLNEQVCRLGVPSGTTASLLLIKKEEVEVEIWMGNVGDSSIFGFFDEHIRRLSFDHNITKPSERKRVEGKLGMHEGYVVTDSGNMLAMTRAIGDVDFGPVVTAQPTVKQIHKEYEVFALASDGIWDVVSGRDLWQKLHPPRERKAWRHSAYRLNQWRNSAYPQHDNTSLMLVFIDWKRLKEAPKEKPSRKAKNASTQNEPIIPDHATSVCTADSDIRDDTK